MSECRFDLEILGGSGCLTHDIAAPALCTSAAAALQAEVTRLNEVCGTNEALLVSINQLHDAAQARVLELEAKLAEKP